MGFIIRIGRIVVLALSLSAIFLGGWLLYHGFVFIDLAGETPVLILQNPDLRAIISSWVLVIVGSWVFIWFSGI